MKPYTSPRWAQFLPSQPQHTIQLAMKPTPIQRWRQTTVPDGYELYIKRDDMTGSSLGGNKVRKLEFLMADAISRGCKHILSCGSIQSNHARAVAISCSELALQSHLFLRSDLTSEDEIVYEGNLLLSRLCGANLYFIERRSPYISHIKPRMEKLANKIKEDSGEDSYLIPVGGSVPLGNWGYFECFEEIRRQGVVFDDIVCVCGSGGMTAGLSVANYLSGSPYKVHGMLVCDDPEYFHGFINDCLTEYGLRDKVSSEDIVTLHDDYKQPGYDRNLPEQLKFIAQTAQQTGILLDNCYTGKAAYGLQQLLLDKPEVFKGRRILFIHSGMLAIDRHISRSNMPAVDSKIKKNLNLWLNLDNKVL